MKSMNRFIMLIIGMMVFTATAHTAKLEQKQKTELVKDYTITKTECVNEVFTPVFTCVSLKNNNVKVIVFANDPLTYFAIITDVGWRNFQRQTKNIAYKEKLLDSLKSNSIKNSLVQVHRIRSNPFASNTVFSFKRYC